MSVRRGFKNQWPELVCCSEIWGKLRINRGWSLSFETYLLHLVNSVHFLSTGGLSRSWPQSNPHQCCESRNCRLFCSRCSKLPRRLWRLRRQRWRRPPQLPRWGPGRGCRCAAFLQCGITRVCGAVRADWAVWVPAAPRSANCQQVDDGPRCKWVDCSPSRWRSMLAMTLWVPAWAIDTTGNKWMWEDMGDWVEDRG